MIFETENTFVYCSVMKRHNGILEFKLLLYFLDSVFLILPTVIVRPSCQGFESQVKSSSPRSRRETAAENYNDTIAASSKLGGVFGCGGA